MWPFGKSKIRSTEYLKKGRLEDVIALIQILALDDSLHRGEPALARELGEPMSATAWTVVAARHPEFFRLVGDKCALIVRRLMGDGIAGSRVEPVHVTGLIKAAIALHAGQLQRRQIIGAGWTLFGVAVLHAAATVAAAIIQKGK